MQKTHVCGTRHSLFSWIGNSNGLTGRVFDRGNHDRIDSQQRGQAEYSMIFLVELEQEEDGRWIAEVAELPGVLAYGKTPQEARAKVQALALRVVAEYAIALQVCQQRMRY
jgi:predicted RNase H-like HicB family nuclease